MHLISAEELLTTPLVGESCDGAHQYALQGYTTGTTLQSAISATKVLTHPSLTNLSGDNYIIVWNTKCQPIQTLKVHMLKYLDGQVADATSANSYLFPMSATWQTANLNGGAIASGTYVLGNHFGGAADLYGADTALMNSPADYSTYEITGTAGNDVLPIGAQCIPGRFRLKGYQISETDFTNAAAQTLTITVPTFTNISSDRYVIVVNETCPALIGPPTDKDQCKKSGWKSFNNQTFKNQGACVSYIEANENAGKVEQ